MSSDITIAAAETLSRNEHLLIRPDRYRSIPALGVATGGRDRSALRDSETSFAGFFDGAEKDGYLLVPILAVWATPSGIVTAEHLPSLVGDLVGAIAATRPDGVLLALHGAMVSELEDDADGWLLQSVRETVGADVPIVATLDLHANISQRMVDSWPTC